MITLSFILMALLQQIFIATSTLAAITELKKPVNSVCKWQLMRLSIFMEL